MRQIKSVSVCQPAVRMLAAFVEKDEDGEPWAVPVVGIESCIVRYEDEDEVQHEPIVLLDGHLDTVVKQCKFLDLVGYVLVADWPAEEDAERLKPVLDSMGKRTKSRNKVTI